MPLSAERLASIPCGRDPLRAWQLAKLNRLIAAVTPQNRLWREQLGGRTQLASFDELAEVPLCCKNDLLPPPGATLPANATWPAERYIRFHQTSGTRGRPMAVLDSAADWQWWLDCWQWVLDLADIAPGDTAMLAFSFGPFIGFWSAFDALVARGVRVVPAGGLSTAARLDLAQRTGATVLFGTPSYALRMMEVAASEAIDLRQLAIRKVVVAGEPGGSVAATRAQIETAFGATLFDHVGASEVGPWGLPHPRGRGVYVLETEFLAELLPLPDGRAQADPTLRQLVLTTLGREGCPVLRYATGDVVRAELNSPNELPLMLLAGGVLGRVDDMLVVRGVNIFPSSIEQIVREQPALGEFRLTVTRSGALDDLQLEVEGSPEQAERLAGTLAARLGLRCAVRAVPPGSLPRSDGKQRRMVDLR